MKILRQWMSFCAILLFFNGCCREENAYNAIVLGADLRLCACCGGLLVKTNDGKTYQAFNYPEALDPATKNDYPFQVSIEYKLEENTCFASDGIITISKVEF